MSQPRQSGQAARVHDYIRRHPGITLYVSEIAEELDISVSTVSSVFSRAARASGSGVRRAEGRGAYTYTGPRRTGRDDKPVPIGTLMEVTGYADNGEPVIRAEDGSQFVARKIK